MRAGPRRGEPKRRGVRPGGVVRAARFRGRWATDLHGRCEASTPPRHALSMGRSALVIAGCLFLTLLVATVLSILWRPRRPQPRKDMPLSDSAGDAQFAAQAR